MRPRPMDEGIVVHEEVCDTRQHARTDVDRGSKADVALEPDPDAGREPGRDCLPGVVGRPVLDDDDSIRRYPFRYEGSNAANRVVGEIPVDNDHGEILGRRRHASLPGPPPTPRP